jgi:type VI secretion system protein ImpA
MAASGGGAPRGLAAEPVDAADAAGRVIGAARFLRRADPANPASYLLLRALRWGELRADAGRNGGNPDARLLEAPTTQMRTQLRGLMLDANWEQLIEAAESVMATPVGRGWLDLQRYTLTACQALGEEYAVAARAIRSELRAYLAAIPSLPGMTLMDDMPTATAATQQWLREERLVAVEGEGAAGSEGAGEDALERAAPRSAALAESEARAGLERAASEVRAGRPEKGIELLMRALQRERTRRGRFLRQAELARIMVDAGFVQVARPILEELITDVDNHRLEEWEAGDIVARPLALLYRCLEQMDEDSSTRQALYVRVARLDPLQALSFRQE